MIITIDGPTASGKSSAARSLAKKLNYYCVSSGAFYRAVAYILVTKFGYDRQELENPLAQDLETVFDQKNLAFQFDATTCGRISWCGADITSFLKSDKVSQSSSIVATNFEVRKQISDLLQRLVEGKSVVLEGRDLGSVVFDDAKFKFYLTAELGERAKRWQEIQKKRGAIISFEQAKEHIRERDHRDQEREHSPLIIPKEAIVIDNSRLNLGQTVDLMVQYVQVNQR